MSTFRLECLYIAHGDPKTHRVGLVVVAKAPGWKWSSAERGEIPGPNGMRYSIIATDLTDEQLRDIELRRIVVDDLVNPTGFVPSPEEWWIPDELFLDTWDVI